MAATAKRRRGAPTKYDQRYLHQGYKLALLGLTDAEIADVIGVTESTLNNWKQAHPEFLESLNRGKVDADADIAVSLYERAKGYSHPEEKIFCYEGEPIRVETTKHYPPDTNAASIWLYNRQRNLWKSRQHMEHSGPDGKPIELINASMSAEEAARLYADTLGAKE
jgi:transcriptional regulator with XRE-family HTH domain